MNPRPALRPDLAAACLFANASRRSVPNSPRIQTGVLADLARNRFCK